MSAYIDHRHSSTQEAPQKLTAILVRFEIPSPITARKIKRVRASKALFMLGQFSLRESRVNGVGEVNGANLGTAADFKDDRVKVLSRLISKSRLKTP
jgi:hypothetical protein